MVSFHHFLIPRLVLLLYLDFFTALFRQYVLGFLSVCLSLLPAFTFKLEENFLRLTQLYCEVYFVLCLLVCSRLVYLHTPRALGASLTVRFS